MIACNFLYDNGLSIAGVTLINVLKEQPTQGLYAIADILQVRIQGGVQGVRVPPIFGLAVPNLSPHTSC